MSAGAGAYPDFASGGLLMAGDLAAEQAWQAGAQAALNGARRGPGVVRGLEVGVSAGGTGVTVAPGLALDQAGRLVGLEVTQTVDLSTLDGLQAQIVLWRSETPAGWRSDPGAAGYTRIETVARVSAVPVSRALPAGGVLLATVSLDANRLVRAVGSDQRALGALTLSTAAFPRPDGPAQPVARIVPGTDPLRLHLAAPRTQVFGTLDCAGPLAVGLDPQADLTAGLNVAAPGPIAGTARLSSSGATWYADAQGAFASVSPGDALQIDGGAAIEGIAPGPMSVRSVESGSAVTVDRPLPRDLANVGFAYEMATLMQVRDGLGRVALRLTCDGHAGLGATPGAEGLRIDGGDVRIGQDNVLAFATGGELRSADNAYRVGTGAVQGPLAVSSAGTVGIETSGAYPDGAPDMVLCTNGHLGIGTATPDCMLSVNGTIRARKGLVFPDGTIQTLGVVPIPIGTVVDWWHPQGTALFDVPGFQVCDGSTITDPASPLKGQTTPDLSGRIVRGVTSYKDIGQTGGSATHTHAYTEADHHHDMFHQHRVSGTTDPASATAGDDIAGDSVTPLHHVHTFELTSSGPSPEDTGKNTTPLASKTGEGSSLPPNMPTLKVMRIR